MNRFLLNVGVGLLLIAALTGCETVHEGAKAGGTYIGKGTAAVGGVTEGAADGYVGSTKPENNPYNR
ncbi:MAG: hypothetical protein KAR05_07120 [Candidatus Omnitrophica bacterium]|nr:hypothetical protein [Candidatus Omnitrophota bacterium]